MILITSISSLSNLDYLDSSVGNRTYLPDMKTASYWPLPAAAMRCLSLFSDGTTSKAGGSTIQPANQMKRTYQDINYTNQTEDTQ